jgi:hypothetical protein
MAKTRRVSRNWQSASMSPACHNAWRCPSCPRGMIETKPSFFLLVSSQRKKRTHVRDDQDPAKKGQPKSFVFRRGRHGVRLHSTTAVSCAVSWGGPCACPAWDTAAAPPATCRVAKLLGQLPFRPYCSRLPRVCTVMSLQGCFPPKCLVLSTCPCSLLLLPGYPEGAREGLAEAHVSQHRHTAQGGRPPLQAPPRLPASCFKEVACLPLLFLI